MYYIDENGEKVRPYIIHRTSIGCYERTLAWLIEKYAGKFPTWLCPRENSQNDSDHPADHGYIPDTAAAEQRHARNNER